MKKFVKDFVEHHWHIKELSHTGALMTAKKLEKKKKK